MSDPASRYTVVAILLHWLIALAILANIGIGWWMHRAIESADTRATAVAVFQIHKSIGLTVLLLSLLRLAWRLGHPPPPLPENVPVPERLAARVTHTLFYGLMIAVPLSGWLYVSTQWRADAPLQVPTLWFGLFEVPHVLGLDEASRALRQRWAHWSFDIHWLLAWSMAGLFLLHVAAALKHHFLDGDGVLARMIPFLDMASGRNRRRTIALWIGFSGIAMAGFVVIALLWQPVSTGSVSRPANAAQAEPKAQATTDSPVAPSENWILDRAASAIEFSGTQGGSTFEGRFERWTVDIRIDPANVADAHIQARIETASATDGHALHDRTLTQREWFDPETHPYARYRTTAIEPLADGGYRLAGMLTIKDKEIAVPDLHLTVDGDTAVIRGQTVIDRADADLGMSSDPDGEWVSRQIEVEVNAVLRSP